MRIAGEEILPGQTRSLQLPIAELPSGTPLALALRVVRGRRPGPRLFVSAAVHGDEVNGVEILRRVLRHKALKRLRGTLMAIPVVNVFGFTSQSRYLPDRRDLNRCFPGSGVGSLGSRLAHLFMTEVVVHATHGVDLHTGAVQRTNLPQIRITRDHAPSLKLARRFGAPVVIESPIRDGSLRAAVAEAGVPLLVYEGGEANRFDEWAIRAGVRGVMRILRALGMLPARATKKPLPEPLHSRSTRWVRAPESGVFRPGCALGSWAEEGDLLGRIADPLGYREVEVRAPFPGVVVGRSNNPLVHEGDALYNLARLDSPGEPPETLEDFDVDLQQPFLIEEDS